MLRTIHTVIKRWQRDEAALLAAAVSYYIALSLFPVLLILTSGLGAFFKWTHSGNDARDYLLKVIGDQAAPSLATAIEQSLGHIEDYSPLSGPIGMAILLFAALAIFAQFERAFDRMWNVRAVDNLTAMASVRQMLTNRFRAFVMLCGLGLLIIAMFFVGVLVAAMKRRLDLAEIAWVWWGVELALQIGINAFAFAALYRFLPKVYVPWKDAARGGFLAAIVWEIGRQVIATLVIGQHYSSAYGIIGCFLAIMLWGYYAVAVIFFGAEFVQVLGETTTTVTNKNKVASNNVAIRGPITAVRMPKVAGRLFDVAFASLLLYLALFLGLRHFRSQEVAGNNKETVQRVVRFSDNPRIHQCAMRIFAPLISSLPGPYQYAHADEASDL